MQQTLSPPQQVVKPLCGVGLIKNRACRDTREKNKFNPYEPLIGVPICRHSYRTTRMFAYAEIASKEKGFVSEPICLSRARVERREWQR